MMRGGRAGRIAVDFKSGDRGAVILKHPRYNEGGGVYLEETNSSQMYYRHSLFHLQ